MGWSDSDNPSTTEDGEYGEVLSTSYSPSYSHASPLCSPGCPSNSAPNSISEVSEFFKARRKYAYRSPTSLVSPPLSPELTRVLDIADDMAVRRSSSAAAFVDSPARYRNAVDDITASFEPMESDDAVEEWVSRVESVETTWTGDEEGPVFHHEAEMVKDGAAQLIRPIV